MSKEEGFEEVTYQMVMRASWKMLQSGLLSENEYIAFEAKMRVAAYARVSVDTLHHSLAAQVSYYSTLIQKNPE